MRRLKFAILLLWLFGSVPLWASYGTIQTSGGKTLQGNIRSTNGGFVVSGTNGEAQVALNQIARVRFLAQANNPGSFTNAQHGLRGTYFSSSDCTGDKVVRIDPTIDFNWQDGYPIPGIGPVDFSVRWEGRLQAPASGRFTFYAQGEGVKLWLNNQLLIDKTEEQQTGDSNGAIELEANKFYTVKLELYNHNMTAVARLFWNGPSIPSGVVPSEVLYAVPVDATDGAQLPKAGLVGLYFNTPDFSGESISRFDSAIDFDWGEEPPMDSINPGMFSVRWLGKLMPKYSEAYTFKISAENGARVWLGGNLIIDVWKEERVTATSVPIRLKAGETCDLRVEMFSARGAASAKLEWSSPSTPAGVIPSASLLPAAPPERHERASDSDTIPAGVRLASGSFLAGPIQSADESSVQLTGPAGETRLSLINVSRLLFQPLTPELSVKIAAGRTGLLLKNKDFVEGEFKGIVDGKVRINSVIFGLKSYELSDAVALILRDLQPKPTAFEVRLKNGSVLRANQVQLAQETILVEDPVMKACKINLAEVVELGRNDASAQSKNGSSEEAIPGMQAKRTP